MHSNSLSCHDDEWRLLENTLNSFVFQDDHIIKTPRSPKIQISKNLNIFSLYFEFKNTMQFLIISGAA